VIAAARLVAAVLACAALVASAQTGSTRRPRSDAPPQGPRPDERMPQANSALGADPVFALERELPSLRADLGLEPGQKEAWSAFERAVRDTAELQRQRTRKLMAPRPIDAPAPNAVAVVNSFADDDRLRAEAMAAAAERFRAVYEILAPEQRALLDRRALLALTDPLGR
jgi:hypothetical protein